MPKRPSARKALVWYEKGLDFSDLGKYDEEIKCYDKAIEINPKYDSAWNNKGIALGKLGKYDEALKCYDKAIEINPNNDSAWYNKGVALGELGKHDEAIKYFSKAIEINPNNDNAWNNKGIALRRLGKYDEALKCYDKAIEINPNNDNAWNNKGIALGELGKHDEAIKYFSKAIEINPDDADLWYNKGIALGELGKHDEAIKCYDKAIEINPDDADLWSNKGKALHALGKHDEALKCFAWAHMLTRGISLGEYSAPKPAEPMRPEESEIIFQFIDDTKKKWVRVALVQLDFSLELNCAPKEFGYTLENKQETKKKVLKALDIAKENKVNIICFPELSISDDWIEETKTQYQNMIIVFGTYYKNAFNTCPIIVKGQDYYIQKINPSPYYEKAPVPGRYMKKGKKILIFQTECGKFVVLICLDCKEELYRILHHRDPSIRNLDFVIVPEYNRAVTSFQEYGNLACQEDNFPYILHANASKVFDQEVDGTCVIGMEHESALRRYRMEGWKSNDSIKYKLIEAKGETMVIIDLNIRMKAVLVPASEFKMRFVGFYPLA